MAGISAPVGALEAKGFKGFYEQQERWSGGGN
jgi:hypothetical protein